ncbi:hypothetical protein SAY87_001748 [Trapa incisa]|uniref:Glucose-6-phosphate dehydrogenase C-terminal domain-containing protein n=1 Tax=Trapa incisa TaxID=236973 RepID=A0AAN7JVI0_9MYRT|nr:hypothetical protein SAY87_001748 [Trapa incisa]
MRPLKLEDVVVGQYKSHNKGGATYPGYTEDETVPKDSLTPTFAAAALFIDNARWDGVPFLMKAGKALHDKIAEIRVQFRHVPGNLYNRNFGTVPDKATNELVIRVQPDEAIYLKINNKVPGLGMRLDRSNLNLLYAARLCSLLGLGSVNLPYWFGKEKGERKGRLMIGLVLLKNILHGY